MVRGSLVENPRSVGALTHPVVLSGGIHLAQAVLRLARGLLLAFNGGLEAMRTDDRIRKQIALELVLVNQAVEVLKKEPRPEELEGLGDNTPLSEEVDAMVAVEDSELRSAVLSRYLDRAAALDEARHRLDAGSYGICVACGKEISPRRLEAVPEALNCTRCQEEVEKVRHREIHAHEWKRAEETFRERLGAEGPEPKAITGGEGT